MRLAIVGGSAPSTPSLFLTPHIQALSNELETVLIGRSIAKLDAVARALRVTAAIPASRLHCATDDNALSGADVVLLQARYGGYDARARDETFPLKFGMCGDEGLGPGGLAAGWRSWPEIAKVLAAIRRFCPRANVLLMTAPLGLLVRCARRDFADLRLTGICELPWVTLQSVCSQTSMPIDGVRFDYAGINHLGWFDRLRCGETDVIERYAQQCGDSDAFPSREIVETSHAIPLKYLAMHYDAEAVFNRQRSAPSRASELARLQTKALAEFAAADSEEIIRALARRSTPWYTDAVGPCIAALAGKPTTHIFFFSTQNDGYLPQFDRDDIVEVPFRAHDGAFRRLERHAALSPMLTETLQRFIEYERTAAEAIASDARDRCAAVLAKHPWTRTEHVNRLSLDVLRAI